MERRASLGRKSGAGLLVLGLSAASCTEILGIDKDYRESSAGTGGGSTATGESSASSSTSASTSASSSTSASGGPLVVGRSWDPQTVAGSPPKMILLDANKANPASITAYQSHSPTD